MHYNVNFELCVFSSWFNRLRWYCSTKQADEVSINGYYIWVWWPIFVGALWEICLWRNRIYHVKRLRFVILHSEKWPRSTKIVIRLLQHDVVDVFTTRVNNTHHCEAELIEVVLHVNLFNILFRFYRVIIIYNTTNINFHIHVYNT